MLYVPTTRIPVIVEMIKPRNPQSTLDWVRRSSSITDTNLELPTCYPMPFAAVRT